MMTLIGTKKKRVTTLLILTASNLWGGLQAIPTTPTTQVTECGADYCGSVTCVDPSITCAAMSGCFTGTTDPLCPHSNAQEIKVDEKGYSLTSAVGYTYGSVLFNTRTLIAIKMVFSYFDPAAGLPDKEYQLGSTVGFSDTYTRNFAQEVVAFKIDIEDGPALTRLWFEDDNGSQQRIGRTNVPSTSGTVALTGRWIGLTARYHDFDGNGYPTSSIGELGIIVDNDPQVCAMEGMFVASDPFVAMTADVGTGVTVSQTQTVKKNYAIETCGTYTVQVSPSVSWVTLSQPSSTTLLVDVASTDSSLVGTVTTITLTLTPDTVWPSGLPATINYTFDVTFECATNPSFATPIADLTYLVAQGSLVTSVFNAAQTSACNYAETLSFTSVPDVSTFVAMDASAQTFAIDTSDPAKTASYVITVTMAITAIPAGPMTATFTFTIDVECVVQTLLWSPAIPAAYTHQLMVDTVPVALPFDVVQSPLCSAPLTYTLTKPGGETWISNQADSFVEITANSLSLSTNDYTFTLRVTEPISGTTETSTMVVSLVNLCESAEVRSGTFETQILFAWKTPLIYSVPFTPFSVDATTNYGLDCGDIDYTTNINQQTPAHPDPVTNLAVDVQGPALEMAFDDAKIMQASGLRLDLALTGSLQNFPPQHQEALVVKVYSFGCTAEQTSYHYKVGDGVLKINFALDQGPDNHIIREFKLETMDNTTGQEVELESPPGFLTLRSVDSHTDETVSIEVLTQSNDDAGLFQVGFKAVFSEHEVAEFTCLVPLEIEPYVSSFSFDPVTQDESTPEAPTFSTQQVEKEIPLLEIGETEIGTQFIKPLSINCESQWSAILPAVEGEDSENVFSVSVDLALVETFLNFDSKSRIFKLIQEGTTDENAVESGVYQATVTVTSPLKVSQSFEMRISYLCGDNDQGADEEGQKRLYSGFAGELLDLKLLLQSQFADIEAEVPKVAITRVTADGVIKLTFTNQMMSPDKGQAEARRLLKDGQDEELDAALEIDPLQILKLDKMVKLELAEELLLDDDDLDDTRGFTWSIESYSERTMDIRMVFDKPLQISSSLVTEIDRIQVTFVDTQLIFDVFGQEIEPGTLLERAIPPQFQSEDEAKILIGVQESFQSVQTGAFSSDFTLNALIASSLQMIWSLVLSQQIVIMMPLLHITMPANAGVVMSVFFSIVAYEMVPTAIFYGDMLKSLNEEVPRDDHELQRYQKLGLDSVWVLPNLDSLLLFMVLIPLYILCLAVVASGALCLRQIYSWKVYLTQHIFWNWPILFLKESYIILVICCLINVKYGSWETGAAVLNTGLAYAFLTFALIYPVLLYRFLQKRHKDLGKKVIVRNYRTAINQLRVADKTSLYEIMFFYYRRLLLPAALIVFPEVFILQYAVLTMSGVSFVIYICYVKPYNSKLMNRMELVNEIVIIFLMYHILCFTDFVPQVEIRHKLGYSVIVCMLLNLVTYYAVLSFFEIRDLLRKLRRRNNIRKVKLLAQVARDARQSKQRKSLEEKQNDQKKVGEVDEQLRQIAMASTVTPVAQLEAVQEKSCESSNSSSSSSSASSSSSVSDESIPGPGARARALSEEVKSILQDGSGRRPAESKDFSLASIVEEEKKISLPGMTAAALTEDSILAALALDNTEVVIPLTIVEHRKTVKQLKKHAEANGQIYEPTKPLRDDNARNTIDQERYEGLKKLQIQPNLRQEIDQEHYEGLKKLQWQPEQLQPRQEASPSILNSLFSKDQAHMAASLAMKNLAEDRDQLEDASIEDLYKKFPFTKMTESKTDPLSKQSSSHSQDNSTFKGSKSATIDDFSGGATMGFQHLNQIAPNPQPTFLGHSLLALQPRPSIAEKRRQMDAFNRQFVHKQNQ